MCTERGANSVRLCTMIWPGAEVLEKTKKKKDADFRCITLDTLVAINHRNDSNLFDLRGAVRGARGY